MAKNLPGKAGGVNLYGGTQPRVGETLAQPEARDVKEYARKALKPQRRQLLVSGFW
jgi:hypothetical protein